MLSPPPPDLLDGRQQYFDINHICHAAAERPAP